MAEQQPTDDHIPVLTEVVVEHATDTLPGDRDMLIAELQTALAARTFELTEEAVRNAFSEMEAQLFEHVAAKLRRELPELIDNVLREHLETQEHEEERPEEQPAERPEEQPAELPAARQEKQAAGAGPGELSQVAPPEPEPEDPPVDEASPEREADEASRARGSDYSLAAWLGKESRTATQEAPDD